MTRFPKLWALLTGTRKPKPPTERDRLRGALSEARKRHAPTRHILKALKAETEKELSIGR